MALTLRAILSHGFLPQELPPPFTSLQFGEFVSSSPDPCRLFSRKSGAASRPCRYNLARSGSLRRELSALNPIDFTLLAAKINEGWNQIDRTVAKSRISLSRPQGGGGPRALQGLHSIKIRPEHRARLYARGRYVLKADINRFYHSIYTHSIPWALHGKAHAKAKRRSRNLGNELDRLVRACQDNQTNGIPVGPDTSLALAELVLANVDAALSKRKVQGLRYVDDYELVFDTEQQAIECLAFLQEKLLAYELHLNPAKTRILPLPQPIEEPWVDELRRWHLDAATRWARTQIIGYFDRAFALAAEHPDAGVIKYAVAKVAAVEDWGSSGDLVEDLLVHCARVEPGALPHVLGVLLRGEQTDGMRIENRRHLLGRTVIEHAPKGHSSEVAWALWAHLALSFVVCSSAVRALVRMDDPICTLLGLHARSLGLTESPSALDSVQHCVTQEGLYDRYWPLAYEAFVRGWLPSGQGADHLGRDPNFKLVRDAGVHFYDDTLVTPDSLRTRAPHLVETTSGSAVDVAEGAWWYF